MKTKLPLWLVRTVPVAVVLQQAGFVGFPLATALFTMTALVCWAPRTILGDPWTAGFSAIVLWLAIAASGLADARSAWVVIGSWFLTVFAVTAVVRRFGLYRFYRELALGSIISLVFLAAGSGWWYVGDRWSPWEINPNQAAMNVLAFGILFAYLAVKDRRWILPYASTVVLILMSGSRGALIGLALASVPLFAGSARRLIGFLVAVVIAVPIATDSVLAGNYTRDTSARFEIAGGFFSNLTPFGRFALSDGDWQVADITRVGRVESATHAHNAFLWVGFLGGGIAAVLMLLIVARLIWKSEGPSRFVVLGAVGAGMFGVFPLWPSYLLVVFLPAQLAELRAVRLSGLKREGASNTDAQVQVAAAHARD